MKVAFMVKFKLTKNDRKTNTISFLTPLLTKKTKYK